MLNGMIERFISADGLVTKITLTVQGDDGRILEMRWLYTHKSYPELAWVYAGDAEERREVLDYRGMGNIAYLLRPAACVWRILEVEELINLDNQFTVMQSNWWREVEQVFEEERKRYARQNA